MKRTGFRSETGEAAEVGFHWLLRFRVTVMNSDKAGAGVSPPKEARSCALSQLAHPVRKVAACCICMPIPWID